MPVPVSVSYPRSVACSRRTRPAAASISAVLPKVRVPTNSTVRWKRGQAFFGSNSAEFW
ncbi:MAG TPA: hypothetical protein VGH76_04880 [Actinomycetospora sp.]|uniref:hypothetical protein n=1 Tax=Actinomycetospora sp. TaxID=1872135 RepID=UPI002F42199F